MGKTRGLRRGRPAASPTVAAKAATVSGMALAAVALAAAMAAVAAPQQALAYFSKDPVSVSFGSSYEAIEAGQSCDIVLYVDPLSEQQLPGCGMDICPEACNGLENPLTGVMGGCLSADGWCSCGGTAYVTETTRVTVASSNPYVARASVSGSSLHIDAYEEGEAVITVYASLAKHVDASASMTVSVAEPTAADPGAGSGAGSGSDAGAGAGAGAGGAGAGAAGNSAASGGSAAGGSGSGAAAGGSGPGSASGGGSVSVVVPGDAPGSAMAGVQVSGGAAASAAAGSADGGAASPSGETAPSASAGSAAASGAPASSAASAATAGTARQGTVSQLAFGGDGVDATTVDIHPGSGVPVAAVVVGALAVLAAGGVFAWMRYRRAIALPGSGPGDEPGGGAPAEGADDEPVGGAPADSVG